jgi:hypothetical protein
MANLVAVLATTHHPFFYRASTGRCPTRTSLRDKGW